MPEIISEPKPKEVTCRTCGSTLRYISRELHCTGDNKIFIICPACRFKVVLGHYNQ